MDKKKVTEAQGLQKIWLLKDKTKSHKEIADLLGVISKCVFQAKCNYEMTSMTKELPRSERHESLPAEMSLIFLERSESMLQ
ncbi:unnamed protein product [Brachionus calyciflorus]|uniref:Uncharacterized protein n=1 Tax=Brachionus calyciflorus TaxID=104777 RepID=A0A814DUQ3_9BILA|nr:unnamed protein product [Brachionus calyciflorus]